MLKLRYTESTNRYYFSKGKIKKPIDFKVINALGTEINLGFKKNSQLENELPKEAIKNSSITTLLGYTNLTLLALVYFLVVISVFNFNADLMMEIVVFFLARLFVDNMGRNYFEKVISGMTRDGWELEKDIKDEEMKLIDSKSDEIEKKLNKEKIEIETKKGKKRGLIALGFFLFCFVVIIIYLISLG